MHDAEYIQECKEWIARRKARVDQMEKRFNDQYPLMSPATNQMRMNDLEAWRFEIEVNEWELSQILAEEEGES
jgi:hypothetical protein